ncbi:MAG: long-chain fatty acid--CoA ligase [Candidatus Aminicenantes bacterium]|nr:long-chain fatty acid--CoA ligase [Candidatus Aminicenantes bacterium]
MVNTLAQLFFHTIKSFPKADLMLYKEAGEYKPISTEEFGDWVICLSLGLRELGLNKGDKLALLAENSPEWVMTDLASLCLGSITVPIYTSLVPEQIKYIVNDSDTKIVVCSDLSLWEKVKSVKDKMKNVEYFLIMGDEAPEGTVLLSEVIEKGKKVKEKDPGLFEKSALEIKPDDTASIIYTSGTTGTPKGVILSHSNFISNSKATSDIIKFTSDDYVLSFLPLSHVLERMVTFTYLYKGCSIAYAESVETVAENLLEIRPHIMVSVPRVFEKIYAKVMDTVLEGSALKKKIFFWGVKVGKEFSQKKLDKKKISKWLELKRKTAHKIVFSKIISKTGGRVRFFVSGGAPLSKDIAEFFYGIGLVILEGYGLTETSPVIAVNTFEELRFGSVGKPIPGVEVKIADDGEILTRGPNLMKGYYKKEEETNEAIKQGWFYTGDIGHLDEDNFLYITDRKKDIIVTAGGKNVAPQIIENQLKTNPFISNAVVIGDRKKFVSALVVPEFEKLEGYAKASNIEYTSRKDLIENEKINNFMMSEIDRYSANFASYERVKRIVLLDRDFEIEKGELTPSLKVRRNIVEDKYKDVIDKLYQD